MLDYIGTRNLIGVASGPWSKDYSKIRNMWQFAGVGYIILKTFMDCDDKNFKGKKIQKTTDYNMTLFHKWNTAKENFNFDDNHDEIVSLLNRLFNEDIAVIPNIGTKKTDEQTWEKIERYIKKTPGKVLEINLRYLYRGLISEFENKFYGTSGKFNEYSKESSDLMNSANIRFHQLLQNIRQIFPKENYALIGKIWAADPSLTKHLNFLEDSGYDAVTLVNSKKELIPHLVGGKNSDKYAQMSGYRLREYRDEALGEAKKMNYSLPIFASGGVAMEAARKSKNVTDKKQNVEDAVKDIERCFEELNASYVQLGSVIMLGGKKPILDIMNATADKYNLKYQKSKKAA